MPCFLSLLFSSTEDVKVGTNRVSKEYPQGTKLKVLYGRGKNQKIYEAKVCKNVFKNENACIESQFSVNVSCLKSSIPVTPDIKITLNYNIKC